ncbi:MAG: hypothetical protein HYW47_04890 [Deltaproteobacteria bacterium]|nr:hypothetical protein [Deltaproteobacteria bacterium]
MNITNISEAHVYINPEDRIHKLKTIALVLFVLTSAHFVISFLASPKHALFNYLLSFSNTMSLALAGLFWTLVHHATKAHWSVVIRRISESFTFVIPFGLLLTIPLFLGLDVLYTWSHDHHLQHKALYLNDVFFILRTIFYFSIWLLIYFKVVKPSYKQDQVEDLSITQNMWKWSCIGLVLFGFTISFAAIDWLMTLDPHWFSTIFGVYYFAGSIVAGLAAMILIISLLKKHGYLQVLNENHLHDLGKLLFGMNVFWAYIAFSQYLLIWYGNIPEETIFFHKRTVGSWNEASLFLPLGHFLIPFMVLLSRSAKRNITILSLASIWLLLMHYVDLYWLIMPNFSPEKAPLGLLEVCGWVWSLSLVFIIVIKILGKHPLIPLKDPQLQVSLEHHQ